MKSGKLKKLVFYFLFVIYILLVIYIAFLWYGRSGNQFGWKVWSKEHFEMLNLVPFTTISSFLERGWSGKINIDIAIRNLMAPFCMYVPMGMALPVLFHQKFDKLWKVLVFILIFAMVIEVFQFVTFCGSADIDDLILNIAGATIGYGIIQIGSIKRIVKLDEVIND